MSRVMWFPCRTSHPGRIVAKTVEARVTASRSPSTEPHTEYHAEPIMIISTEDRTAPQCASWGP